MDHSITVHDLTMAYPSQLPAIDQIDLCFPSQQVIGIMGPNGAGKSTLLKAMMDLLDPTPAQGMVKFWGKPFKEMRQKISYVSQKHTLDWDFPASVLAVTLMGSYGHLGFCQWPKQVHQRKALACLEKVGIQHLAHRPIAALSVGQQQRLLLARALTQEARLYLLDEPFVGVDAATEAELIKLFQAMAKKGKTIVVVHHDLQSALRYFTWGVLLNKQVIAAGPISKVLTPPLLQKAYGIPFLGHS